KDSEATLGVTSADENSLHRVVALLKRSTGAESTRLYSVIGQHLTRDDNIGNDSNDQEIDHWIEASFKINPNCKRHVIRSNNRAGEQGVSRSVLSIPVALEGRRLIPHDFRPLVVEPEKIKRERVVVLYVLLCDKRSPSYLGGSFSQTDLRMAQFVASQLGSFIRARGFEQRYVNITELFETLSPQNELSYKECRDHLINETPVVSDIGIIEVDIATSAETWKVNNGERTADSVPESVQKELVAHIARGRGPGLADENEPAICTIDGERAGVYLLVHLPTNYVVRRYAVLTLDSELVDQVTIDVIIHFIKELHMFFRSQDAMRERGSMLAQIRHAFVSPLAAAKLNLETFHKEFERSLRSVVAWDELKRDDEFRDLLTSGISLTNQALLIAQTGRYLL